MWRAYQAVLEVYKLETSPHASHVAINGQSAAITYPLKIWSCKTRSAEPRSSPPTRCCLLRRDEATLLRIPTFGPARQIPCPSAAKSPF